MFPAERKTSAFRGGSEQNRQAVRVEIKCSVRHQRYDQEAEGTTREMSSTCD